MLGHSHGFPVPVGGAGVLIDGLVRRLRSKGGELRCDAEVTRIEVAGGRATGVVLASGERLTARRAVLADVAPRPCSAGWWATAAAAAIRRRPRQVRVGHPDAQGRLGARPSGALDATRTRGRPAPSTSVSTSTVSPTTRPTSPPVAIPRNPFLLFGQMTTADPSRSPAGTESAWAYTHLPRGARVDDDVGGRARRAGRGRARAARAGLRVGGRGSARPVAVESAAPQRQSRRRCDQRRHGAAAPAARVPSGARSRRAGHARSTGCSSSGSSTHPGGGVHGACGSNAARSALARQAFGGGLRRSAQQRLMTSSIYR